MPSGYQKSEPRMATYKHTRTGIHRFRAVTRQIGPIPDAPSYAVGPLSQARLSADAIVVIKELFERSRPSFAEHYIGYSESLARMNFQRLLAEAEGRARLRRLLARRKGFPAGRPIIQAVDIREALRQLCPLWPFC